MKRPMLFCGLCAIRCSISALLLSKEVLILFAILFAVLFLVSLFIKSLRFLFLAFLMCFIISLCGLNAVSDVENAYSFSGEVTVNGTVCEISAYDNAVGYIVKTESIGGKSTDFKLRLISYQSRYFEVGDKIAVRAKLSDTDVPDVYSLSERVYRTATVLKLIEHTKTNNVYSYFYKLRKQIAHFFFYNLSSREASVMLGLTTGDTGYIDADLYENIRYSGVTHVIVVSGLHLSIIAGSFLKLARRFKLPLKVTGIIGVSVILAIVAVTGFTVSALRASVAFIIMFIGYFSGRRPDALNSLFAAITLLCLENPFVAGSISFQLSSAATFGIIVLSPLVLRNATVLFSDTRMAAAAREILSVLFTSLSATIMTAPFIIWHFGAFSLVSLITNIIICYPVSIILILCVISLLCYKLEFLYRLILLAAGLLTKAMLFVTDTLGGLPFAMIESQNPLLATVITAILAGLAALYCLINIDKRSVQSSATTD